MLLTPTEDALLAEVRAGLGAVPGSLGVAVSGGSDSLALLYLLAIIAREEGTQLHVVTVDHGLRAESRAEAEQVAAHAKALGLSHDILSWQPDDTRRGNLQGEARDARYRLLTDWAQSRGIPAVAVGHTADDQAETVLMRLRRASGVTGLSAMPRRHSRDGTAILRPMLGLRRDDLRAYLKARGLDWIDDPSNQDLRFERVRVRDAMKALEPLGLTVEALAAVADNMRMADAALDHQVAEAAQALGQVRLGAVVLDRSGFNALAEEIARRLLVGAVSYVTGLGYPPRRVPLMDALRALGRGRGATLQGCQILVKTDHIWICREYQAVRDLCQPWTGTEAPAEAAALCWDETWRISGPVPDTGAGFEVRALGADGLAQLEDWRGHGAPREVLMTLPAVWRGDVLVAVPPLQSSETWSAAAIRRPETWAQPALSH
ncbi:tRNA lysidine(34) synthetase TilS [Epibacterium sp. MM17-32]|uniref:tRNA lysidine(34) synthetase TilS n=1 Tax=Epibacterium sp. MM17-32 TaxID=2917734 RepID=UPI001EF64CA7|nr:tRNA lysidine(34) synthetase TilS [Epibacterium sp. MM17-32]